VEAAVRDGATRVDVPFVDLSNSLDASKIEPGGVLEGENFSLARRVVEGGPRWGGRTQRSGYNAADAGRGLGHARFGATQEIYAVVEHHDELTVKSRLYLVDPSTGAFTAVSGGSSQAMPAGGTWTMVQYAGYVYFFHDGASAAIYRRKIGTANGNADALEPWTPRYNRGAGFGMSFVVPPNTALQSGTWTAVDLATGIGFAATETPGGFRITYTGGGATDTFYMVLETPEGFDLTLTDVLRLVFVAGSNYVAPTTVRVAFSASQSTINLAWCQQQDFISVPTLVNTSGANYEGRADLSTWRSRPNRTGLRRIVFELQNLQFSGNGTFTLDVAEYGGVYTWDVTYPSATDTATDVLTLPSALDWPTTTAVIAEETVGGLTAGTTYYWRSLSSTTGSLHPTALDATNNTARVNLTATYTGRLTRASLTTIGIACRWANKSDPTTTLYTPIISLPPVSVAALRGAAPPSGHVREHSLGQFAAPYDARLANLGYGTTQFLIQRSDLSNNYRVIAEATNSPGGANVFHTGAQSVVDASAFSATPTQAGPPAGCEVGGVWKQHFLLAANGLLWMSFQTLPDEYVPAPDELKGSYDPDDPTIGRTLYAVNGQSADVEALAGGDHLWIGGRSGIAVMIGDTAIGATEPRLVGSPRPLVSRRGLVPWRGGCLAAHEDGLFYYQASRALAFQLDTTDYEPEELTANVRSSWRALLGSDFDGLVLAVDGDEVWAYVETRFMRLTRPDAARNGVRSWEYGTWPALAGAVWTGLTGGRMQLTDGRVGRIGRDASGTQYTTDNGAAVDWSVETGDLFFDRLEAVELLVDAEGAPDVTLRVADGANSTGFEDTTFTTGVRESIGRVNVRPGSRLRVRVSGTVGTDVLRGLAIGVRRREGVS
jgi:hypothetical protein